MGPGVGRSEGHSRLWASIHLVSCLRRGDPVLTVEDNVFLLGFIGIYPVDGLRDTLKLLLGDGIAAVGETL